VIAFVDTRGLKIVAYEMCREMEKFKPVLHVTLLLCDDDTFRVEKLELNFMQISIDNFYGFYLEN
jgi:hypothetical protein